MLTTPFHAKQVRTTKGIAARATLSGFSTSSSYRPDKRETKFIVTLKPVQKQQQREESSAKPTTPPPECSEFCRCQGKIIKDHDKIHVKADDLLKGKTILNAFRLLANSKFITIDDNYKKKDATIILPPLRSSKPNTNLTSTSCEQSNDNRKKDQCNEKRIIEHRSQNNKKTLNKCQDSSDQYQVNQDSSNPAYNNYEHKNRINLNQAFLQRLNKIREQKAVYTRNHATNTSTENRSPTRSKATKVDIKTYDRKAFKTLPCDNRITECRPTISKAVDDDGPRLTGGYDQKKEPCDCDCKHEPRKKQASVFSCCKKKPQSQPHRRAPEPERLPPPPPPPPPAPPPIAVETESTSTPLPTTTASPTPTSPTPSVQPVFVPKKIAQPVHSCGSTCRRNPKVTELVRPRTLKDHSDQNKSSGEMNCNRIGNLEQQVEELRAELGRIRLELIPQNDVERFSALDKRLQELNGAIADMKKNCMQPNSSVTLNRNETYEHSEYYAPPTVRPPISDIETQTTDQQTSKSPSPRQSQPVQKAPRKQPKTKNACTHCDCNDDIDAAHKLSMCLFVKSNVCECEDCGCAFEPIEEFVQPPPAQPPPPAPTAQRRQTLPTEPQPSPLPPPTRQSQPQPAAQRRASPHVVKPNKKRASCCQMKCCASPTPTQSIHSEESCPYHIQNPETKSHYITSSHAMKEEDSAEPTLLYKRRECFCAEEETEVKPALAGDISFCRNCDNTSVPVISSNLLGEVYRRITERNPHEVALTILLQRDGFYHINIAVIKTGESIGCLLATETSIKNANEEHLFEQILTFFIVDSRNSKSQKNKILDHTFEFVENEKE